MLLVKLTIWPANTEGCLDPSLERVRINISRSIWPKSVIVNVDALDCARRFPIMKIGVELRLNEPQLYSHTAYSMASSVVERLNGEDGGCAPHDIRLAD